MRHSSRAAQSILLLLIGLGAAVPAFASWSFTATLYQTSCPASVPLPSLPSIGPFPVSGLCQAAQTQIQAINQSFTWSCPLGCSDGACSTCTCRVGYNTTSCFGSDDPIGSSSTALPNSVNSSNAISSGIGQPAFTTHYDQAQAQWQFEAQMRASPFFPLNNGIMPAQSVSYANRFRSQIQSGSLMTLPVQTSAPDQPERTTLDGGEALLPMIGNDANPVPITGAGISYGKPDKVPPPNPQHNEGEGKCPDKRWFYNTVTRMCYQARENCMGNGVEDRQHLRCTPSQ